MDEYRILSDGTIDILQPGGGYINISQEDLTNWEAAKLIITNVPTIQKMIIITGAVGFIGGLVAAIYIGNK